MNKRTVYKKSYENILKTILPNIWAVSIDISQEYYTVAKLLLLLVLIIFVIVMLKS